MKIAPELLSMYTYCIKPFTFFVTFRLKTNTYPVANQKNGFFSSGFNLPMEVSSQADRMEYP